MSVKKPKCKPKKGGSKVDENLWAYQINLELLLESGKLSKDDVLSLCCRDKYCIRSVMFSTLEERDDEVYRMFGDMVGQNAEFMKRWLQVHVLPHKQRIATFARDYLNSKGLDIMNWLNRPKTGKRADILALFLLCKITNSHCFVHTKEQGYWSSLDMTPCDHDELLQKCNLHLAYLGSRNYAQLILMNTGLETAKPLSSQVVSASAGSPKDLTSVKEEVLTISVTKDKHTNKVVHAVKLVVEPLVKVKKLSSTDIAKAK